MVINELKFSRSDIQNISSYQRRMNDELKEGEIGYYHLPDFGYEILNEISKFKNRTEFKKVVLIGVGGSSLGVKAVYEMLNPKIPLVFLDNIDPFDIENKLKDIK
ncbi:MAG: glucose-6-phosphate isomerase, partial [Campylobacter hyointestinalis]